MMTRFVRLTAVLLAASLFSFAAQAEAPKETDNSSPHDKNMQQKQAMLPQWKPDAKMLPKLQPEYNFGLVSMRIPTGFVGGRRESSSVGKARTILYEVIGAPKSNFAGCSIVIGIGIAAPGHHPGLVGDVLRGNTFLRIQSGLTKSAVQQGEANGLVFSRQYFQFPAGPGSPRFIHGFEYVTIDERTSVLVGVIDEGSHYITSLPLAEAAVLTLHRIQ